MKKIIILCLSICYVFCINAQQTETPSPIIFIYDASGSMMGRIQGKTKMDIASSVLIKAVNELPADQKIGLVAYGHRKKEDCKDVEFLVNMESGTKAGVTSSLKKITPLGRTPLAYSAQQVIDQLRKTKKKATIILVTDGIESCGGNICDVIKSAKKEGIEFKLHIVGFGLKANETEQLKCAAEAGEGEYYDAANADGLGNVLTAATQTTVDNSTGNFTLYAVKNEQAVDALIKIFKAGDKNEMLIKRTYRDTISVYLPPGKYDMVATPLENSKVAGINIKNVESFKDSIAHKTISFDGGKIVTNTLNNGEGWDALIKIISIATGENVASGRTYKQPKELEVNPGLYKVRVEALTELKGLETIFVFDNVQVNADETIRLEHNFKSGIAMIGATSGSALIDALVTIKEAKTKKDIYAKRTYTSSSSNPREFILNPGTYTVTVAAVGKHSGKKSTFTMTVTQGQTFEKTISF